MYFVASESISSSTITRSRFSLGKALKYPRTFSGASTSSLSVKSEYTQIRFPVLTLLKSCKVASSNSLSKAPPKTGSVEIKPLCHSNTQFLSNLQQMLYLVSLANCKTEFLPTFRVWRRTDNRNPSAETITRDKKESQNFNHFRQPVFCQTNVGRSCYLLRSSKKSFGDIIFVPL